MSVELVFVSPPSASSFMGELLAVVADAVTRVGVDARTHVGRIEDLLVDDTVPVIVPHEYLALYPGTEPTALRRCIGFGVEHPGTATFESAVRIAPHFGAWMEIGGDSVVAMRNRGVRCDRFVLGYSPIWDRRATAAQRDTDVLFLGTADKLRLRALANIATDLVGLRSRLFIPPHEPMTEPRPYFLVGEDKWRLLARSRLILNVHRELSTAFEWVRALEAMSNGCVVLSQPSTGLHPLEPGKDLLVASSERLGRVARAALDMPEMIEEVAGHALQTLRDRFDMSDSAERLVALAEEVCHLGANTPRIPHSPSRPHYDLTALAQWIPSVRALPSHHDVRQGPTSALLTRGALRRHRTAPVVRRAERQPADAELDVICVCAPGDGPLTLTAGSLSGARDVALHVATNGVLGCDPSELTMPQGVTLATHVDFDPAVSRGRARNELLDHCHAPFVLVLDAGDELLNGTLPDMAERASSPYRPDVVYPMAVLGSEMIVNVMVPEPWRLTKHAYLSRGYLIRRSLLDRTDGFAEDAELDAYTDHDLWVRMTAMGASYDFVQSVGIRLWPQELALCAADADPQRFHARIAHRRYEAMRSRNRVQVD